MTINKTLTDEEFEDYRALAEILPETQSKQVIQRLIAKVDSEKQDRIWAEDAEKELIKENEELTEELIRGCAFTEDFEKLKSENENLAYTIRLLRSSP